MAVQATVPVLPLADSVRVAAPGFANRWKGLGFIGLSLLVISLDNTVLNLAIPSLSLDLGATNSQLQWLIDAYTLIFAALLLTAGAISDRFGRKRTLMAGLAMFAVGSLAAALSTSTGMLIATRGFLGIAGALIMPSTLSIINVTFPPEERAKAIGIWSGIFGIGVGIGPLIGGFLLKISTWHLLFMINIPVIAIALIGLGINVVESRDETKPSFDILGVILSFVGLIVLVYGIIQAGSQGWTDPDVLKLLAAGIGILILFGLWEMRSKAAMLPIYLFKNMSFTGGSLSIMLVSFSLSGSIFFLSQYLQTILGYDTLQAGLGQLPLAISLFIFAPLSSVITRRLGTKYTVALGIGVAALALLYMGLVYTTVTPYISIAIGQILLAAGLGTAMAPTTTAIMSAIPANKSGVGSAMNDTTRQLGGALGVAILGAVMASTYLAGVQNIHKTLPLLPDKAISAISNSIQGAHQIASDPRTGSDFAKTITSIADSAFVDGMTFAMKVGAIIMLISALFVLLVLPTVSKQSASEAAGD